MVRRKANVTSKERIIAALEHREADRTPIWESFWGATIARWKSEGMPEDADPTEYFGLDPTHTTAIDWTAQFERETIEETDEYTIFRNNNGAMQKSFKGHESTPLWWDFPITDRASWEEIKPRMLWNDSRVDIDVARPAWEANKDKFHTYLPACLGFEKFKYLMGTEGVLVAIAEHPDWVREMCDTTADLCIDGLEHLLGHGFEFDVAFVTEDMGFKGMGFFSPRAYREIIMPCQKRFCDFAHARGLKVMLHTCGMNMELVPLYIEAGFDVLNPMEVKAGMDPLKLKKDFGDVLTLWGGIDVRAIAHPDPQVLEREICEKVPALAKGGGYIFSSDHSIPEDVSLERYKWMLELGRKYGAFGGGRTDSGN